MSHILANQTINNYTPFTSRIYHMHIRLMFCASYSYRDQSVNAPCQWEMTLQCNAVSHWLGVYTEWSMHLEQYDKVCSVIVLTILFIYYVQKFVIITNFCTCHDSPAVVPCTKFCSYCFVYDVSVWAIQYVYVYWYFHLKISFQIYRQSWLLYFSHHE